MTKKEKLAAIQNLDGLWEITKGELVYEDPSKKNIILDSGSVYNWFNLVSDKSNPNYGLYKMITMPLSEVHKKLVETGASSSVNPAFLDKFNASCILVTMVYDSNLGLFNVTIVDADDTTIKQFTYKGGSEINYIIYETGNDEKQQSNAIAGYSTYKKLSEDESIKVVGNETADNAYIKTWEKTHPKLVN